MEGQAERSSNMTQAPGSVPNTSLPSLSPSTSPAIKIVHLISEVMQEFELGIQHQFSCLRSGYQLSSLPA